MTTDQRIILLEQVQKLCEINKIILSVGKDIAYTQGKLLLDAAGSIVHGCDILNKVSSNP